MYRALTWLALERKIDVEDEKALGRLARETAIQLEEGEEKGVTIDGRGLSWELRGPQVDKAVSLVARVGQVRSALVAQQREIASGGRIVVVGRDIGTNVLPDADLKLFLAASVPERARRRHAELREQGHRVEYHKVLQDLVARDKLDTERDNSPLRPAADALLLDTAGIDLKQVEARALALVEGT